MKNLISLYIYLDNRVNIMRNIINDDIKIYQIETNLKKYNKNSILFVNFPLIEEIKLF